LQLAANEMCFACGKENPIGLRMKFTSAGEEYRSELEIGENYQGYAGIAHGGILATALDEIMARLLADRGYNAITARLEVRFLQPVEVGKRIHLRGRILRQRGRLVETAAWASLADGTPLAEAKAASLRV